MISAFYHCGIPLILLHRDEKFKEIPLYIVFCFLCEIFIDGEWFKIFLYLSLFETGEFWASGLDHWLTNIIHLRFPQTDLLTDVKMVENMVSLVDVFAFFTDFLRGWSISEQNLTTFMVQTSQICTNARWFFLCFFNRARSLLPD